MTKAELFTKYSIDQSHSAWSNHFDNWMSVELYRLMHDGALPPGDDLSTGWIIEFLDKMHDKTTNFSIDLIKKRDDWGSLYLTAKRMIYRHADEILKQLVQQA